jgi:glucose-1-phosphate cytidylyltransferase
VLEREPFERCAADGQLQMYRHDGFWQCMDTVRDWEYLERQWAEGHAPWKVWA